MKIKRTVSREILVDVLKKGRVQHSPLFSIRILPSPFSACTAIVSKKVAKTAVARNRAKRRVRDIVALLLNKCTQTFTVVVFLNKSIEKISVVVLKQEITLALTKLKVL
jgi:ribonuclease P protein component